MLVNPADLVEPTLKLIHNPHITSVIMTTTFLRSLHLGRVVPEVEPTISRMIQDKEVNLKKVATRRNMGFTRLPIQLEVAAQAKIQQVADTQFRREARYLISVMHNLKLPDDRHVLKLKRADLKTELEIRDKIKEEVAHSTETFKLHEESYQAREELARLIDGKVEERRRDWRYYEYDERAAHLYMATRLAPNYACLRTVMQEIRDLDPSFEPKSVLDFGSGMGTTVWSANETWPNKVNEFMNVDISKEQEHLCEYLLRGGRERGESLPDVIHRQYLPSSNRAKYDLVVAAFSLLELPNMELRVQTIENLWNKTNDILVIVERGNKGGFATVNEARNLVLDLGGYDTTRRVLMSPETMLRSKFTPPSAHVLAPCSHELVCPRLQMPSKKRIDICRFRIVFEPLELGEKKPGFIAEEFSYVVLRKGQYRDYFPESTSRWPRAVEKKKRASGQICHKLCCPDGNLAEVVITKKYGKAAYEIGKSCDWGDIVPISVRDEYRKKPFNE